jgi:DEAD/DEAH box helicase domain-containing protein
LFFPGHIKLKRIDFPRSIPIISQIKQIDNYLFDVVPDCFAYEQCLPRPEFGPYNADMTLSHILDDLRRDPGFMANVMAWQILPAHPARTDPIPAALHPALATGLRQRGITQLYSHQSQAVHAALAGKHVAVVTPTASGKTLCYNLPVIHSLLSDEGATALYLFPTKALAHDQLEEIADWQSAIGTGADLSSGQPPAARLQVNTYDGDTPAAQRTRIRRESRMIITNPDMLHVGILPYHAAWATFFAGLRYVVIDEMHSYRGVFGSHVANVLRRLQRIAAFYGSRPQFVLTSATIANPRQLAQQLIEAPVELIDENGAPRGEKHVIIYNPPLYDPARGLRRSSVLESQDLAVRLLLGGAQTIVFGRSRLTVEVLLTYVRERLARVPRKKGRKDSAPSDLTLSHAPDLHRAIRGYRGGYLPEERRSIEAGLRSGGVRAVVTTNALELGIDIGQLEAALICGYPGTIASTWQQMGRAGRTADASLSILVVTAGALDQYIASHPAYLLEQSPEHAFVNPDNLMLLVDHLRCAAFELPFHTGESFGQSTFVEDVLALLVEQGDVNRYGDRHLWQGESYPARQIGLRSTGGDPVLIQRQTGEGSARIVGEIDVASAPLLVHAGAVYLHEGQSYLVDSLDLEARLAQVTPTAVDFYTEANTESQIQVLAVHESKEATGAHVFYGDLLVTSQVKDYRRVRHYTHETLGHYPLDYPPQTLETSGYWFEVSAAAQERLMQADQWRDAPNDYGPNWQEQRKKVRARDGYCCQKCGLPEPAGGQHDVHHLTPFRTFGYIPGFNENYQLANRLTNLLLLCRRCHQRLESGVRTRSGLDGLAYALQNLAPLYLMCDRSDIGMSVSRDEEARRRRGEEARMRGSAGAGIPQDWGAGGRGDNATGHPPSAVSGPPSAVSGPSAASRHSPRIYIFERIAAGLGFSRLLFERHDTLLTAAQEMIRACPCRYGCPACVGPVPLAADSDVPLLNTKELALSLLNVLRQEDPLPTLPTPPPDEVEF